MALVAQFSLEERTMTPTRTELSSHANSVVALFPEGLLAFEMPRGATFADLAERIAYLGERMDDGPISIAVRTAN
jgi:hypothetical protein